MSLHHPESPSPDLRALIDIGTNSVKLLVARVHGRLVEPVHEESEQTRLGRGFYESHVLQKEAIEDTVQALIRFKAIAGALGATHLRTIATSAARDASNQAEFLQLVKAKAGLQVEVISGEQEAEWVYQGVTSEALFHGGRLLILDVGGGSTEFILGEGVHKQFQESLPLGSVRLLEQIPHSDPPQPAELARCREHVRAFLSKRVTPSVGALLSSSSKPTQLIGTGGASTIMGRVLLELGSFERHRLDGMIIHRSQVTALISRFWSMSLADRRHIIGLPRKRADVILTGTVIYEGVMDSLGFSSLRVSTRGLRFGGIMPG